MINKDLLGDICKEFKVADAKVNVDFHEDKGEVLLGIKANNLHMSNNYVWCATRVNQTSEGVDLLYKLPSLKVTLSALYHFVLDKEENEVIEELNDEFLENEPIIEVAEEEDFVEEDEETPESEILDNEFFEVSEANEEAESKDELLDNEFLEEHEATEETKNKDDLLDNEYFDEGELGGEDEDSKADLLDNEYFDGVEVKTYDDYEDEGFILLRDLEEDEIALLNSLFANEDKNIICIEINEDAEFTPSNINNKNGFLDFIIGTVDPLNSAVIHKDPLRIFYKAVEGEEGTEYISVVL